MTDLTGGIVLLVRKPDPEPYAAPGLTPLARAHATGCALGMLGQDITPLIDALEQTRRDALEEAASLLDEQANAQAGLVAAIIRAGADRIRALKDTRT